MLVTSSTLIHIAPLLQGSPEGGGTHPSSILDRATRRDRRRDDRLDCHVQRVDGQCQHQALFPHP